MDYVSSEVTSILAERLTHKVNSDSDRLRFVPGLSSIDIRNLSSHGPDGDMKPRTLSWTWISESFFGPQVRWWPSALLTQGRDGPYLKLPGRFPTFLLSCLASIPQQYFTFQSRTIFNSCFNLSVDVLLRLSSD